MAHRFRQQEQFARGYSPLYERLFGVVAGWLESDHEPLAQCLLGAAAGRQSLDVTLLLAAGLHRDILAGEPGVAGLSDYYPSVGGHLPAGGPGFEAALRAAVTARRQALTPFIQAATVQTNETGRGLCWLLPLQALPWQTLPWQAIELVDLGASAGLNLAADRRRYRLAVDEDGADLLSLGSAPGEQFVVRCRGQVSALAALAGGRLPDIAGRTGCDLAPFPLAEASDRLALMAFVWGDQEARLARLAEGIAAFDLVQQSAAPIRLYPAMLPDDLETFLAERLPGPGGPPVVIYNTYMTAYLSDKGASLPRRIGRWAATQARPVLWLQWEPPRDGSTAPEYGWCHWTADLWQGSGHHHWRLAWVHPHGKAVEFLPEMRAWQAFWQGGGLEPGAW